MKVKPLNDGLLLVPMEEKQKTSGGIIIPDTAKSKPKTGKVAAVGPGKLDDNGSRVPMDVKIGDHVLFDRYSGTEIMIDNVELLFMREGDILGVLE